MGIVVDRGNGTREEETWSSGDLEVGECEQSLRNEGEGDGAVTEICGGHPRGSAQRKGKRRSSHELGGAGQDTWLALSAPPRHLQVKAAVGVRGEQPLLTRITDLEKGANWE